MTRIRDVLTVAGTVVIGVICMSLSRRTRPSPCRPPVLYVIDGRRAHRDRVELGILGRGLWDGAFLPRAAPARTSTFL